MSRSSLSRSRSSPSREAWWGRSVLPFRLPKKAPAPWGCKAPWGCVAPWGSKAPLGRPIFPGPATGALSTRPGIGARSGSDGRLDAVLRRDGLLDGVGEVGAFPGEAAVTPRLAAEMAVGRGARVDRLVEAEML